MKLMKIKLTQLVLSPTNRLEPEKDIGVLINHIRKNGLKNPIEVETLPWGCGGCETINTDPQGHCFNPHCKCGAGSTQIQFKVIDGFRRVKAFQFLDIDEIECIIVN